MPPMSPRRLDQAAERRWPWLFQYRGLVGPLYLSAVFMVVAGVYILIGEPFSYGAVVPIAGAVSLNVRVAREMRRTERANRLR